MSAKRGAVTDLSARLFLCAQIPEIPQSRWEGEVAAQKEAKWTDSISSDTISLRVLFVLLSSFLGHNLSSLSAGVINKRREKTKCEKKA
jgi:hypothetical protein